MNGVNEPEIATGRVELLSLGTNNPHTHTHMQRAADALGAQAFMELCMNVVYCFYGSLDDVR